MKTQLLKILLIFAFLISKSIFSQDFTEKQKIIASDRNSFDDFAYSVSVSGNYAVVGAQNEDEDSSGSNLLVDAGSVYVFEKDGSGNWIEKQKLVPVHRHSGDKFGQSVSINGDYVVVGAYLHDRDANNQDNKDNAGAAFIFKRAANGVWSEVTKLVAPNRKVNDWFGWSVAISGNYVVVGAVNEDEDINETNFIDGSGSAYVFENSGNDSWNFVKKITASERNSFDSFGHSVAIDGNHIVVGAYQEDEDTTNSNTVSDAGAAYIFERNNGGVWSQTSKIVPTNRKSGDWFAYSVSIKNDFVLVGAFQEDEDENNSNTMASAGAAYVFQKNGTSWTQKHKLVAFDRLTQDRFGISVSISDDYAIIGAHFEDHNSQEMDYFEKAGSAYIYKKDANGNWNYNQKIVASDRNKDDWFGWSVATDNNICLVGAYQEDEDAANANTKQVAGSAYLFETSATASLNKANVLNDVLVYPNPVKDFIRVSGIEVKKLGLYDINGRELKESYSHKIEVNNFSKGVYLLKISSEGNKEIVKRVILN